MNAQTARQTLDLSETMQEALTLVLRRIGQSGDRQAIEVLTDTMEAFSTVERTLLNSAVLPGDQDTDQEKLQKLTDELRDGFDWLVQSLEGVSDSSPHEVARLTLLPRFEAWQAALRSCLQPFAAS